MSNPFITKVGKHTYGGENFVTILTGEGAIVEVGAFCSIAFNVRLVLGGNHRTDWFTTFPFGHVSKGVFPAYGGEGHPTTKGDIIIGNDVWLSENVTIMSGVKIGDGAVIAHNSHVVKDVPPYSIVGGNPAKFIKYRFSQPVIDKLLELKWWEWADEDINRISPILCSSDEKALLQIQRPNYENQGS